MNVTIRAEKGWKPIPLLLKVVFVLFVLWAIGSLFAISTRYNEGLPLFGVFVYGIIASFIVVLLDLVAPVIFLFALWNRKSWAASFAFFYIGVFILNSIVAIFTVRNKLGLVPILIPLIANIIFFIIIFIKRNYFK